MKADIESVFYKDSIKDMKPKELKLDHEFTGYA